MGRIEWNSVECEDFTSSDQPFSETAIYEVVFGNQVKRIPDYAFFQCKGLEEVILPASVVSIGEGTFYDCDGLMHVEFGESLESIGKNAFYDCDKLESITLPEKLTFIAPGAFGSLENLKHVTFNAIDCHVSEGHFDTPVFTAPTRLETFVIGDNVTRIPYEICYGKGSFKEIVIPNSVKIIENRAFGGCGIESLTIGENVETMAGAFSDCSGLKELTWNAMRTENPESSNLRLIPSQTIEKLTLGEKVEEIPDYLCYNCTGLSDFTIPDGVKNIGREAFYNTGLTDMFVPASVTEMGWRAFGNNRQLRRVIIPSDEAARAEAPFSACSALEEIVVPDTAAFEKNDNWSAYSGIIKPMVSFSNHQFTYSGKLPETEITNNLTGYTLRLDLPELNKDAGTYTARAEASYDGPYPFSVSVPFKYRIDKARLTLTPANVEKVYGDMNPIIYEYTQEGLVNDETLEEAFEVLPEFSTNTDDRVQTGSYAIELANSPKTKNYDFFCGKGFMTVTPKPLHVTAVNVSRPYGENNPELELMYEGFAFDDDTLSLYRTPYAICDADNLSDAGEYEIRVSGGSGRNYTFDFTYGVLSVTPAVQKIEWEQEWPVLHVGDSIALYACATSGLPVSFATDSPDVCRIVHAENQYFIVCLTEGTARVQATQEGNSNWMAAENTERELSVEAAITGIEDNDINHPDVHADRKQIVVKGTINGTVINVYTLNGTQLHSEASRGNEHRLTMDQAGVYIVNVGGRSFKLTVE